jgi:hypothetical protein
MPYNSYKYRGSIQPAQTQIPNQPAAGTTLTATITAASQYTRVFNWTIDKSVTPSNWELFIGDTATSQYTVTVTRDAGTRSAIITGKVCVTNGGAVATQNLNISFGLERNPGGGFITIPTSAFIHEVNLSAKPVLAPGESFCYDYRITITDPNQVVPGNTYRVTANVTITNHSGHLGTPFGPSPRATTILPSQVIDVHSTISVTDDFNTTMTGITGSTSWTYNRTFTCTEAGTHTEKNTATIVFEDDNTTGDFATAEVTINCYALEVSKTAVTNFARRYNWTIMKDVSETEGSGYTDSITLNMKVGETHPAFYRVVLVPTSSDTLSVTGDITIFNPSLNAAIITGISDTITGGTPPVNIIADVSCGNFPSILFGGTTRTCSYTATLPDLSDRTNTVIVTIRNFNYDPFGGAEEGGTTSFSATAPITFSTTPNELIDETVNVSDDLYGTLGTATAGNAASLTKFYSRTIGPYSTCGTNPVDTIVNTASFVAVDTGTTGTDTATVFVTVSCGGCTHTIGFWKTHAGFTGNNPDLVTPLLPIWLGTPGGLKSIEVTTAAQAVALLNLSSDASNGINRLYAQLLAAKLNIKSGADPSAVASIISLADAVLAQYNAADWNSLPAQLKNDIISWATTLDNYNNGIIGPGHCSESSPTESTLPVDITLPTNGNGSYTININIANSSDVRVVFGTNRGCNS